MNILRNSSIKQRLILIITAISSLSVLLTTLAISVSGIYNLRANITSELSIFASIVGERNSMVLMFHQEADKALAETNLKIFGVKKSIIQSCLYDENGIVFAQYVNKNTVETTACPSNVAQIETIEDNHIKIMQPISVQDDDKKIGYIYVEASLEQVDDYIKKQTIIALFVVSIISIISYLLATSLQRTISKPILDLADTVRQVSLHKDYSIRAKPFGNINKHFNNELVLLTASFNGMLAKIDTRNDELETQYAELARAKNIAESANRAKSHFLANISHELRTPLNAVIGFSSIIMNQLFGPLGDSKYLDYARDINNSGVHLLEVINDILDISKAEAGKLQLVYEEVHIAKAVGKCLNIMSEKAKNAGVTITSDIPKMLPLIVVDRLRFIQIVINILSNAVKFTPTGGSVHVLVKNIDGDDKNHQFAVIIKDNGIGMSESDIERAFQSFGQVDSGLNRKYEGAGLGLPLTKKLMELHKGSIEIESELGVGTMVTLIFTNNSLENF